MVTGVRQVSGEYGEEKIPEGVAIEGPLTKQARENLYNDLRNLRTLEQLQGK